MWEVAFTITPERGYFDLGERALWDVDVYFEAIRSFEFLADGTVLVVYEVDGDAETLRTCLDAVPQKVVDARVTEQGETLVAQLRFHPDETFERLLSIRQSFGVSMEFPIRFVDHEPSTLEIVETGSQEALRDRLAETRELADVHVKYVRRHDPETSQRFRELTERQQEVLLTAVELGYYENPRAATHADIAAELDCSASVVGQHLRRIEQRLVATTVPDAHDGTALVDGDD
ncbi:helix-turn-helix domain-containing protein [Halorientalis halophila]|uniref:helix-turn-helix domain-containing protein n=1 Tax=Halorientalis halophila TaxID=3108499 RepID=UPI00300BECF4